MGLANTVPGRLRLLLFIIYSAIYLLYNVSLRLSVEPVHDDPLASEWHRLSTVHSSPLLILVKLLGGLVLFENVLLMLGQAGDALFGHGLEHQTVLVRVGHALVLGVLGRVLDLLLALVRLQLVPRLHLVEQLELVRVFGPLHDDELAVPQVAQRLELLVRPPVPLHQKHPDPDSVRHQHQHAGELVAVELPEQRLVEPGASVVHVCGRLAVGDSVEEVAVLRAVVPDFVHFRGRRLEVAEILLSQSRLLVHLVADVFFFDALGYQLGGLAGALVGRCVEKKGVVFVDHVGEAFAGVAGLFLALGGELDPVVGRVSVDGLVAVAFRLSMSNEDD